MSRPGPHNWIQKTDMADETTPVAVAAVTPAPTPKPAAKPAEKAKVVAPPYRDYPTIPALKIDSMVESNPYVSAAAHNEALGFPGTLVDGWEQKAVAKMGELLGKYRSLRVYMDACVHCGACTDKCHYFIGTGDPKNMPVARQDLMRSVYRRYYTLPGKLFPKLVGARDMTKDVLDDWFRYYNQCSECRRCSVFCPYGIDTAEVTMAAKEIMDSVGHGHKYVNEIMGKVHKIGNNLGLPGPALENTLEGLEEDVLEDTGAAVKYPLDVKGAEVLLVTPSADFFAEPHVDSLIGYGKVFHAAGISWTLSSKASEAGNFGMFIGNYEQMKKIAMRVREAALELGVKRIVVGECGHAWRVAYAFWNTLTGIGAGAGVGKPDPFAIQLQKQLDPNYKQPSHICEVTWDLIQAGRLKFNKEANDHRIVTFHDSCNVARGSRMGDYAGGQFDIPRNIIRAVANHYVDMSEATTREKTFCCGGGGGLLTDELLDLRVKGALPRMEALNEIVQKNGVNFMATICAICKAQFTKVLPYYGFKMGMVGGVHQLVSTAIVLSNEQ
jgi:Fe-S oxidoreductase